MREDGRTRWLGWASSGVVAALLLCAYVLAGGLGTGRSQAALAVSRSGKPAAWPSIVSITIANSCARTPSISGSVQVEAQPQFRGTVVLGLFFLSQNVPHRFQDTGRRATAAFNGTNTASYAFSPFTPVPGSPAYVIKILHTSPELHVPDSLSESLAIPVCQAVTATQTVTSTVTDTSTATQTSTTTVISTATVTSDQTVTVTTTTTDFVTLTATSPTTITVTTTTTTTTIPVTSTVITTTTTTPVTTTL